MVEQENGMTEYGCDEVPPIEVIRVEINPDLLNAIKEQIFERRPDLKDVVSPMPVDVFVGLPGNKVIVVAPENEETFVPGPDDKFTPQLLIPIALFVGEGSGASGCSVGSMTNYRRY